MLSHTVESVVRVIRHYQRFDPDNDPGHIDLGVESSAIDLKLVYFQLLGCLAFILYQNSLRRLQL